MSEHIVVPSERAGLELDEFLCLLFPDWNKGSLRRQVRDGAVHIDGQLARPSQRLRVNQVISLDIQDEDAPARPVAPTFELEILYEDEAVLVVNKPANLATEPERWARKAPSLAGALLALAESRGPDGEELVFRPRLVHRIDKGTSGAVIVAKELDAERTLRTAFEERRIDKEYLALVEGEHPLAEGEEELIDESLAGDKSGRQTVSASGKPSRTRISVAARFRGYTLIRCKPETGRTHQIRVHLAHVGFPLAIDRMYGRRDQLLLSEIKSGYRPKHGRPERPLMSRLTLHAFSVSFPVGTRDELSDGTTESKRRVEAPLPKDFERMLAQLRKVRRWNR